MCSNNFWDQQDSNSLFKGSIGHVTNWRLLPLKITPVFLHRLIRLRGGGGCWDAIEAGAKSRLLGGGGGGGGGNITMF